VDQFSDDGSREIASEYSKVHIIDYGSKDFDEPQRRRLLLDAARTFPSPRLLLAIDADEVLSSNYQNSREWQTMMSAPAGTLLAFQWANVLPGCESYWLAGSGYHFSWGFMDDGTEYQGKPIHGARIPMPSRHSTILMNEIKILHYQYANWERMISKHRWYQCWERCHDFGRSPTDIYRQYHHMYAVCKADRRPLHDDLVSGYTNQGIDMTSIVSDSEYRWDMEVVDLLTKHGPAAFSKEAIWDVDWTSMARRIYPEGESVDLRDPRTLTEKAFHVWLRRSQKNASSLPVQLVDRGMRLLGW